MKNIIFSSTSKLCLTAIVIILLGACSNNTDLSKHYEPIIFDNANILSDSDEVKSKKLADFRGYQLVICTTDQTEKNIKRFINKRYRTISRNFGSDNLILIEYIQEDGLLCVKMPVNIENALTNKYSHEFYKLQVLAKNENTTEAINGLIRIISSSIKVSNDSKSLSESVKSFIDDSIVLINNSFLSKIFFYLPLSFILLLLKLFRSFMITAIFLGIILVIINITKYTISRRNGTITGWNALLNLCRLFTIISLISIVFVYFPDLTNLVILEKAVTPYHFLNH